MKCFFTVVLCFVLVSKIQASLAPYRGHCLCIDKGYNVVPTRMLKKIEVFPESSSCEHLEIIATLKPSRERRCLNPEAKHVKMMMKHLLKKHATLKPSRERRCLNPEAKHVKMMMKHLLKKHSAGKLRV
ncbi:C-X-C motif chemokine 10-like [Apteryx rowi]|uniref:C-X-C motif chemokine 10-like n=1 Tax=Apteryx rowi TaxID=308060 RepID=UPI000E1CCC8C|nr:C-X-C motif chemokine 10-like [Apteryx rowi]